jgi:hypothetical protein
VGLGYHRFFTEFGGKPGSQGFLANYRNRTDASTDPSWTIIPVEPDVAEKAPLAVLT